MTTLRQLLSAGAALAIATAAGATTAANAQSQGDLAQIMAEMKRLEARVAALEAEKREAKKQIGIARAEAQALRQRLGPAAPSVAPTPTTVPLAPLSAGEYAMVTKAVAMPAPAPSWDGLYAGASFGIGLIGARVPDNLNSTSFSSSSGGGFPTTISSSAQSETLNLTGRDIGAIGNVVLGYSFMPASTLLFGGQVEGGVSNVRVNLSGSGGGVVSATTVQPPNAPVTSTANITNVGLDTLDGRWMLSALARGGVLIDPRDLAYLIGGYTDGRFDALTQGFGLNGATVGIGWEREIAAGWTLRGEYRFTKFESKDVTLRTSSSTSGVTQGITTTGTSDGVTVDHVSADMHSLSLGVTHYFGQ